MCLNECVHVCGCVSMFAYVYESLFVSLYVYRGMSVNVCI